MLCNLRPKPGPCKLTCEVDARFAQGFAVSKCGDNRIRERDIVARWDQATGPALGNGVNDTARGKCDGGQAVPGGLDRHHAEPFWITNDLAHRKHMHVGRTINRSELRVVGDNPEKPKMAAYPVAFCLGLNRLRSLRLSVQRLCGRIPDNQQYSAWTRCNDARQRLPDEFAQAFPGRQAAD